MKFLVIDDSQEIIDAVSLCLNLRWPQADVLSSSEGRRGLELVEEAGPDLVILDIGLPDMNGLEASRCDRAGHLATRRRSSKSASRTFTEMGPKGHARWYQMGM